MSSYNSNPLTYIPEAYKKPTYFVYALTGLVLGCIELASELGWVGTALAIYGFVGLAIGATAGSNVTPAKPRSGGDTDAL